ncbi:MAG: ribulose-phosphate 3-epimerase [Calditrichaeota bacterium]|nr:ribulose-phosphate 3-epimerase [Calditrichota bacterium]
MLIDLYQPNQIKIAASLLAADMAHFADAIAQVEPFVDYIHCDIMDGHFVPNLTFGPPVVKCLKAISKKPLDVHLMIEKPGLWVDKFLAAGLIKGDFLTFHIEAEADPRAAIARIRSAEVGAGLSVKPGTPFSFIEPYLDILEQILIMTVEPGFGGQSFISEMLPKIAAARRLARPGVLVGVDGGIDADTAPQAVKAGADLLIAGSAIFGKDNIEMAVKTLKEKIRLIR